MKKIKNNFKSVRMRLFLTLCTVIIFIIVFLIMINNIDILIKEGSDTTVITTNKDFLGVARKNKY